MTVKPLQWVRDPLFGGERGMVGDVQYRHVRWDYGGAAYGLLRFDTLDEAKAAAQRDHDAFILNAVEP